MTSTSRHPVLTEIGLASSGPKNPNGKRSRQKQEQQQQATRPIGALDVLQQLLETNVVTADQVRAAHKTLTEARGSADQKEATKTPDTPPIDYRTRHVALRIYYEGKEYSGLAQNVGQDSDKSIERHIFAALQKTRLIQSRETCNFSRCGRTDKGVSAVGQVIALQLKSAIPLEASWDEAGEQPVEELPKNAQEAITVWVPPKAKKPKKNKKEQKDDPSTEAKETSTQQPSAQQPRQQKELREYAYEKMLNSLLPPDIRVLGWCPVSKDFSARFSASDRTYRYFFLGRNLNLDAMKQGLTLLKGTHDFRNLCKANVVEVTNHVRTIHEAEILSGMSLFGNDKSTTTPADLCFFQIQGQAFLWHQIRCIVSVLFMIGRELESPSIVTELLNVDKLPGKPSYPLASEFPLVLHGCGYPNLQLGYSVQNLWTVTCQLEHQWESLVLEAARLRNCLNTMQQEGCVRRNELMQFAKNKFTERLKKEQRNQHNNNSKATGRAEQWTKHLESIEKDQQKQKDSTLSWADAMTWLSSVDLVADGNALVDHVHIPLLQRSKGTTLEEKLEALQQSSTKRSQRYEENVAKKQKSAGNDEAFYEHMLKQGSTD